MIIRELEDMQEVPETFDYFNDFKDTDQYLAMRIAKLERLKAQLNARNTEYWQREQGRIAKEIAETPKFEPNEIIIQQYTPNPKGAWTLGVMVGVKITHVPTGLYFSSDVFSSVHKNKRHALI